MSEPTICLWMDVVEDGLPKASGDYLVVAGDKFYESDPYIGIAYYDGVEFVATEPNVLVMCWAPMPAMP